MGVHRRLVGLPMDTDREPRQVRTRRSRRAGTRQRDAAAVVSAVCHRCEVPVVPSRDMSALPEPNDLTTTLVRALQTHSGLRCKIARTAAALGIHLSTARYRLYRIRELTGFDPADRRSLSALLRITDGQVGL
jgi:hypothetical protein